MLVRELIERLEAVREAEGPDAEVFLVEDGGDRYGIGVSLVSSRLCEPDHSRLRDDVEVASESDRLVHGYFGGEVPLW